MYSISSGPNNSCVAGVGGAVPTRAGEIIRMSEGMSEVPAEAASDPSSTIPVQGDHPVSQARRRAGAGPR